ncbi:TetR/AcrR family transcriptional regulator [Sciscionella marina]|uniref:TetR/AcrR family transcriptional regulator n=1 Tax=Sciscionella marina TaxID=508770 RepID=UPI000367CF20|nr:TetR/AcrR family transcriptional regulator [Sciscionella marina]
MAGKKQFDVEHALDEAMRVFWERGYADASLDALGSATGLGRGSLYGAFGGKDALFRQCLDRYSAIYGQRFEQALADHPDDPVRAVEAFFAAILDRITDPAVPDGCLVAQSAAQSPMLTVESRALVHDLLARQRERVRGALTGAVRDATGLDELVGFVVGLNQSLAVLSRAGAAEAELRSIARLGSATVARSIMDTDAGERV